MNRRTFVVLASIAVVLGLLAVLGQNRTGTGTIAGDTAGQPLLPGFQADAQDIGSVSITGAGGERLVTLERSDTGWTVAEQDDYPAKSADVNSLLIAIAEAAIVEEKTANPGFHARLGVEAIETADAAGVQLVLTSTGGSNFATVILGDAYTATQRYARLVDSDQSVLIDRNPDIARDPADWVEPAIIDIAGERVQRVEIVHADGERVVLRKSLRSDTDFLVDDIPEGRELQYTSIGNVTGSALQGLELDEVAAAAATELPNEVATVIYSTFDGLIITITIATDDGEDPWLRFGAHFDAEQALAFATEPVDPVTADNSIEAADDPIAEAEAVNAALAAWRYRIPSFKYSQLTRRMEDLLLTVTAASE